ncbi:MAG TPA: c-type cytochrome [Steroidobacteraceae bacterium]|nr:c-type cytochrome [Steroidobacteraceae bacterium]
MQGSRRFAIDADSLSRTASLSRPTPLSRTAWGGWATSVLRYCGVAALLGLSAAPAVAAAADRDSALVGRGAQIAQMVCSNCHVVTDDQRSPPRLAQATPSFREIANRPGTNLKALRRFIATTHWDGKTVPVTMPDLSLTAEDVTAVSQYIMALRLQPPH